MFSLKGKTALITGGGSGLGAAIAHGLRDAGATLILVGRRSDYLLKVLGEGEGAVCSLDLIENDSTKHLKSFCEKKNLLPDIVVNAAGINPRISADEIGIDEWNKTIHLNLTIPFFVAQSFVPHMIKRKWGRIINIASLQSERAFANGVSYGASKGGVAQLTRAMAEAWSSRGVNANALVPGFFPSELTAPVFADPILAAKNAQQTAIGRNGNMDDIKGPAVFLASTASDYVTGQLLYVDGGFSAK